MQRKVQCLARRRQSKPGKPSKNAVPRSPQCTTADALEQLAGREVLRGKTDLQNLRPSPVFPAAVQVEMRE